MALRSPLLSTRKRERRKRKLFRISLLSILAVLLIIGGSVFLSRIEQLQISSFEIAGMRTLDVSAVRSAVSAEAEGFYAYVFPKSNSLLYPFAAAEKDLLGKFTEIKEVRISRKDFETLEVSIVEKRPYAIWCGASPAVADESRGCLFLDETGEAYKSAPQFSGAPYFIYYGALASSAVPSAYLPSDKFHSLNALISALTEIFPSGRAYATADGDYELYSISGTVLKISAKTDMDLVVRYVKAFLAGPSLGSAQNSPDKFEYIDVRFGKKVYYKLKP